MHFVILIILSFYEVIIDAFDVHDVAAVAELCRGFVS